MLTKIIAAALLASSAAASSFLQRAAAPTRIWETAYTATDPAAVAAAKATAKTRSPTSQVAGKVSSTANFAAFAKQGILLDRYYAVTHPSQPNYIAAMAGDYFGMNHGDFTRADFNISTVLDLLDTKKISWGLYQEDMPYSGFAGKSWVNQRNGANDYVRKHNPAVIFDKVSHYENNLAQIKNLSMTSPRASQFHRDLAANALPQWLFITPNMTSNAHDTDVTTAGRWLKAFLTPLMADPRFMSNTLILVTFDENEVYTDRNRVFSLLLGDAVPRASRGTTDSAYYNHYSELATVEANWALPTLGRWDVGANVFAFAAAKLGSAAPRAWAAADRFGAHYFNASYAGAMYKGGGRGANARFPAPNLALDGFNGRPVLDEVKRTWAGSKAPTYYTSKITIPDGMNPPPRYAPGKK